MCRSRFAAVHIKVTCSNELPLPMVNMSSGNIDLSSQARKLFQRNRTFARAQTNARATLIHFSVEA